MNHNNNRLKVLIIVLVALNLAKKVKI